MDIEFHYHMTHLIALRSGFKPKDASIIAYASQYTDDNKSSFRIEGGDEPYVNLISQTEDITKPQEERISIYPVFHFCPGTKEEIFKMSPARRDGKYHLLTTIPDSRNARAVFEDALRSGDLYRIGIGTHMYADTFCHCDFAGWKDEFNWTKIDGLIGGLWSTLGPAIGHALATRSPDIPVLIWEDKRLTSKYREKRNKGRILSAAGKIFDYFCTNTKPANAASLKKRLIGDLDAAIGGESETDSASRLEARKKNYQDLLKTAYLDYDEKAWFDAAVAWKDDPLTIAAPDVKRIYFWKDDYHNSDWFKFQEAVKSHRDVAIRVFGKTFKEMEIDVASA